MTESVPAPTTILTAAEAAAVLRLPATDADMLALLPLVDTYLKNATGRDWTADAPIDNSAKAAARMLLVQWYENPAMLASGTASLEFGLNAALTQLEVRALELQRSGVPAETLAIVAQAPFYRENRVAISVAPVLVFNHEMAADPDGTVSLADAAGNPVTIDVDLDVTGKILTITPETDLAPATHYILALTAIPDVYGQTLTTSVRFETA